MPGYEKGGYRSQDLIFSSKEYGEAMGTLTAYVWSIEFFIAIGVILSLGRNLLVTALLTGLGLVIGLIASALGIHPPHGGG
jgi:hypothetical protein